MARELAKFMASDRPDVMLIANHGYGGAKLPASGAPDTGGQHVYVQQLAQTLDELGYRVTIIGRGGFPTLDGKKTREGQEWLGPYIRYVFAPGGGDAFLPQADIAAAIDEQVEWLAAFVRGEAASRGCQPWEVYQLVNSHGWDSALLAVQLIEHWRNAFAAELMADLFGRAVPPRLVERERAQRDLQGLGGALPYHVGRLLLEANDANAGGAGARPGEAADGTAEGLDQRAAAAARRWHEARGRLVPEVAREVAAALRGVPAPLTELVAAERLGRAVLAVWDPDGRRRSGLERVDRHVWTPHTLAATDPAADRRASPAATREAHRCERRSHERFIAGRTRAFAATSPAVAVQLHALLGAPVERLFFFPPCVDHARFRRYADHELDAVFAYLAAESGVPALGLRRGRIVFETSSMEAAKRKDLVLAAFAEAAADLTDAYLFVGGGPDNEVYRALARQREANPVLRERAFLLLGQIPAEVLFGLFSLCAVFCTAAERSTFGLSLAQAAAAGTAAVATDRVPFATQYAADAVKLVPAGDASALARALRALLQDPMERQRRGRLLAERAAGLEWKTVTRGFLAQLRRWGVPVADGKPEARP